MRDNIDPYRWSVIIGLVFTVLANLVAWVFSPKGETRTLVLIFLSFCLFHPIFYATHARKPR